MNKKKYLLLFIGIIIANMVAAQWNQDLTDSNSRGKYLIGFSADADFSSNALTNSFAYNWLTGNYLSDGLKNQVSVLLSQNNRAGFELNYGMYMVIHSDTSKSKRATNYFIALRHKSYLNASFTADDFEVPFFGNAGYAGKTAQLSPFHFESMSYQQVEMGLVCTKIGKGAEFGVGISVLGGQHYLAMNLPAATLYTASTGENLTFNSNAQLMQSDTAQGNMNGINGIGGSLDIYFKAPYKIGTKRGSISVSVSDLGFMWWDKQSLQYQKDTEYSYNGVTINNLNDLQNLTFHTLAADSLQNKYFPYRRGGFFSTIPATLEIKSVTELSPKFRLELGFMNLFNANAASYVYGQGDYLISDKWTTSFQAGYGGYAGLNFAASLCRQFRYSGLSITVNRIQGFVLPAQFGGAGVYAEYSFIIDRWK